MSEVEARAAVTAAASAEVARRYAPVVRALVNQAVLWLDVDGDELVVGEPDKPWEPMHSLRGLAFFEEVEAAVTLLFREEKLAVSPLQEWTRVARVERELLTVQRVYWNAPQVP